MGWSRIDGDNSGGGVGGGGTDTSKAIAVTLGDLIVVMGADTLTTSTMTISDNAAGGSNTYNAIAAKLSSTFEAIWFWAIAKATETITLTLGGANGISTDQLTTIVFRHSAGALSGNPLRGSAQQSHAGTTTADATTSTGLAGTVAGDLIVSYYADLQATPSTGIITQGTGFTEDANAKNDLGTGVVNAIEYELNGAGGTISGTWTLSITDTYGCAVAAFIPPSGGGDTLQMQCHV